MGTVVHLTDQSLQLSARNWDSTYATVCALSAAWEESAEIIPTVTNYLSTNNIVLSSATITDLTVLSSLVVQGTATFLETQSLVINDPIIYVAENNQTDELDVGLAAAWTNLPGFPAGYQYGGLVRRTDNKFWTLFSGITAQPLSGVNLDWTQSGIILEPLSANFYGDIFGNRSVFGSLNVTDDLTINGNISGNNLRTSFNQGSAAGNYSFAVGSGKAFGLYSFAEGLNTNAFGNFSHSEGSSTSAIGGFSHAEGFSTLAEGSASHVEGFMTTASGNFTHAEGLSSQAIERASHAEGEGTIATGIASHSEGYNTKAQGDYSHAEGKDTQANNLFSHAEGEGTIASGQHSHAEGEFTLAQGDSSHAEGTSTQALGTDSHAAGNTTIASGSISRADGSLTEAKGNISYASGIRTTAAQNFTYIWGSNNTTTTNVSTTRTGQYLVSATGGVFIPGRVGIGTDSIANALTVVGLISTIGGNSDQWNTTFNTVCAIVGGNTDQWNSTYNTVNTLSGQWNSTYNTVSALSALWEESAEIIPTVTNYLSTNSVILCSIDVKSQILSGGTDLYNIFSTLDTDAQTLTYTPSSYVLSISNGNTVNLSSINSTVAANSGFWQSTYATVSSLSSTWGGGGTSTIQLSTLTNYLSTNIVVLSGATVTTNLSVQGLIYSRSVLPKLPVPKILLNGQSTLITYLTCNKTGAHGSDSVGIGGTATLLGYPEVIVTDLTTELLSTYQVFVEMVIFKKRKTDTWNGTSYIVPIGSALKPWGRNFWTRSGTLSSTLDSSITRFNHLPVTSVNQRINLAPCLNAHFIEKDVKYIDATTGIAQTASLLCPTKSKRGLSSYPGISSKYGYSGTFKSLYIAFRYIVWLPESNNSKGQIITGPLSQTIRVMYLLFPFRLNHYQSSVYNYPVVDYIPSPITTTLQCKFV